MSIEEIAYWLFKEKSVAIFCHIRPDGDTVGSAVALHYMLRDNGIVADIYSSDDIPLKFNFLKGIEDIKNKFDTSTEYSAYVAVDCAEVSRLGDFATIFADKKNTYVIDHHISNRGYAKRNCVIDRAANAENIYALATCKNMKIDKKIANALAMGIVTDTGNFRHKNVTPDTLRIAANLVEYGADLNEIYFNCFTAQSRERAKLFGATMEKIRYFADGRIAVISIMQEALKKSGAKIEDTEGFIDFIMGIKGVEIGISVLEIDKEVFKISLRSICADVNAVAQNFGGGGHVLSSGCQICGEYEEVVDRITVTATKYIPEKIGLYV